ncbi:MAG: hypothetical protein GF346_10975 [Candidatus Eisenbacteria bacterium]|nr:hypothetical protein [Candidatus Latescibacterota bacterium]MBD3302960.1 hypothetical protein [Candidatus Eisenbacteria bacterium]
MNRVQSVIGGIAILAGAVFVLAVLPAAARQTQTFLVEGRETFVGAEREGVAVTDEGRVLPGPEIERKAGSTGSQVWRALADRSGTIFALTGSEGLVYRIGSGGGVDSVQTPEMEVFAGALGPSDALYVGGAPNGTIVRIGSAGSLEDYFQAPEMIVWDLETDERGNVYAATGGEGALYQIDAEGTGRVLHRVEDAHLLALAWSTTGNLLVGTDGRGLLLEVDPRSGEAEVLYDSPYAEISEIAVAPDGSVYFAAVPAVDGGIEAFRSQQEEGNGEAQGADGHGTEEGPPRVYLRDTEGAVRVFWESTEKTIQALAIGPEGDLWVGTGGEAAVYRLDADGEATLVWSPEEREVLDLVRDGERILAATGNPGRVYAIGPGAAAVSTIRPDPLDAGIRSGWGRVSWQILPGRGTWELRTRSGDTEEPDSSWSPWSSPLEDPEGTAVASPSARYLQCEARYVGSPGDEPAALRRIWVPYNEPNLGPRIGPVLFSADEYSTEGGGGGAPSLFTQDLGAGVRVQFQSAVGTGTEDGQVSPPPWVRAVRSIAWKATDPNEDPLRFEVAIRRVGEERFRVLEEDLEHNAYAIDTRTLPEGSYEVRVRATDARANPPGEARTDERIGGPFRVDHTAPEIRELVARRPSPDRLVLEGTVRDAASPLRRLEVNRDGGEWRPVSPEDGFLDARAERFRVELELAEPEEGRWVAVRAVDAAGNEGIERLWLED